MILSFVNLIFVSNYSRYTTITSSEQRSKYKEDFNNEYPEYRELHAVIDKVSKRFAQLEESLRKEVRGSDGYEVSFTAPINKMQCFHDQV